MPKEMVNDFGKKKRQRISEEQLQSIHNKHKRQKLGEEDKIKMKEFDIDEEEDDDDMVGPSLGMFQKSEDEEIADKVKYIEEEDLEEEYEIPVSHEVLIPGHSKTIQCIEIDPIGNRMLTGSLDYFLKLWDFSGMN